MPWVPMEALKLYQLKITLRDVKPPVWRRVLVNGADDLGFISDVIQVSMGWGGGHLHRFVVDGRSYENPEMMTESLFGGEPKSFSDRATLLAEVAKAKTKFLYEYDFGDGWEHDVVVEKVMPLDPLEPQPRCIDGARACPPDDVGGPWGYGEFLEAISDPEHPEHDDMLEWAGGRFDPEHFSVEEVNRKLSKSWPKKVRDLAKKMGLGKPPAAKPKKAAAPRRSPARSKQTKE
jgi:hypothetical protein